MPTCTLYLITPPVIADLDRFAQDLTSALRPGFTSALQVRLKDTPDAVIASAVEVLHPICRAAETILILNDRPDLARALGCDGVHVGQQDAPYAEARRIMGPRAVIGVTCHDSRHLAMEAAEAGADYVAFGAFFPTETKEAPTRADPEVLTVWQETMTIPCVAIGGITPTNASVLVAAGADMLAVSAGVWRHPEGPSAAVDAFAAVIAESARAG
jgi:thiamine-phosphate pyrophosphorylase